MWLSIFTAIPTIFLLPASVFITSVCHCTCVKQLVKTLYEDTLLPASRRYHCKIVDSIFQISQNLNLATNQLDHYAYIAGYIISSRAMKTEHSESYAKFSEHESFPEVATYS